VASGEMNLEKSKDHRRRGEGKRFLHLYVWIEKTKERRKGEENDFLFFGLLREGKR
jgi:hypothetical protein